MTLKDSTAAKVQRAAARLAQLQARQALQELREQNREKALARLREERVRQELGGAVVRAGLGDWAGDEIAGLLLAGIDHFGTTETARALMRRRGQGAVERGTVH
jgi:hypothetical protein